MPKVLLNSSFQINLPHGVARHLGVNPGDYVEFRVIEGGRVVIEKASPGRKAEAAPRPPAPSNTRTNNDFLVSIRANPDAKKRGDWG